MEAKYLIIGGFYHYGKEKKVYECVAINTNRACTQSSFTCEGTEYKFYNEDMYGIPLDEKWLYKLGAIDKMYSRVKKHSHPFGKYLKTTLWGGTSIEYKTNGVQSDPRMDVEFVHQIQLHYRSRGIELEIK